MFKVVAPRGAHFFNIFILSYIHIGCISLLLSPLVKMGVKIGVKIVTHVSKLVKTIYIESNWVKLGHNIYKTWVHMATNEAKWKTSP